mmetsp:Transcript_15310/g.23313  ORF Transcript_15310/g.23313 Transcript_15310/m.23313 type:complete len:239 (-) Transcript_15310:92-808(-)
MPLVGIIIVCSSSNNGAYAIMPAKEFEHKRTNALSSTATAGSLGIVSCLTSHSNLDSMAFVRYINGTRENSFVNLFSSVDKSLFHVMGGLGTRFQKDQSVRVSKCLSFLRCDRSSVFQIVFVSNEHNHHVALRVLPSFFQPPRKMLECVSSCNIVDKQCTSSSAIIRTSNGTEGFLSSGIPNLQLDLLVSERNHAGPKFHSNCQVMDRLESLVGKLKEQARLSHTCITNDNVFEKVGV